jgi:hypothetical protein
VESGSVDMRLIEPTKLKRVTGVGGKPVPILGRAPVVLLIGGNLRISYEAYVVNELQFGSILGADQLKAGKAKIDLEKMVIHLHGKSIPFNQEHISLSVQANGLLLPISGEEKFGVLRLSCGKDLTKQQKDAVVEMMIQRNDAFSWNGEIGKIRSPLCKLELIEGAQPVAVKPYCYSDKENETLAAQVQEWLENDIIEECRSPFNSPLVVHVGGHKDQAPRICLDARGINKIMVKNRYPMPDMDHMLGKLTGRKLYATVSRIAI